MERVRSTEVDSQEEITNVFNRVIDNLNQIEGKLLQVIANSPKKKAPKKKGIVMKKILICLVVLSLSIAGLVHATIDLTEINFTNVNAGNFDQSLRRWFGEVADGLGVTEGFLARGTVYYVDGNKTTAGTGTGGWDNAFNTLSAALAASHADMGVSAKRKWAGRNTIFVMGDTITEDLVLLAQKTDIIGVGNNNPYNKAAIVGNHVIPSTTATPACRFYNMQFYGDAASPVWDITSQGGLEFHNCLFQANGTATVGLEANNLGHLKLIDNWFGSPDGQNFTTAAIQIQDHATGAIDIEIKGNRIHSNAIGIDWNETTNVDCWIDTNMFFTATLIIDTDDSTEIMIVENRAITLVAEADGTSYDFNLFYAIGNEFTGSDESNRVPPLADE